ncbi:integrase, partial [Staphylococcus capitis]
TGMRLTDLLHLKVEDIKNKENKEIKTAWIQQGAPFIKIMIPSDLRNEFDTYIYENQLKDHHLLFQSLRTHKELSRQQAYRIIHHAAKE